MFFIGNISLHCIMSGKPMSSFLYPLLVSFFACLCLVQTRANDGITVDLIHRESSLSPSHNASNTRFERLRRAFDRSFSRKSFLKLTSLKSTSQEIEATVTSAGGEYLMNIGIGNPPVEQLGIVDTGSDLTLTQCMPCTQCYKQKFPIFDPKNTKTYRTVSCKDKLCTAVGQSSCDQKNQCLYEAQYGDGSNSTGSLAADTFTFGSQSQSRTSFPNVVFGCGHNNFGTFAERGAGIIGLGGGSLSIVRQLKMSVGGRFSYCLTPVFSNVSSKLSFGSNAIVTGPNVRSTPLVAKVPDTFYYLTLEGISVGSQRSVHKPSPNELVDAGNIIIDSGTTLTFLPSNIYDKLETTLINALKGKRVSDSEQRFNLCYAQPRNGQFNSPPITAHFRGADVLLPQETTFMEVEDGVVCLTLLPTTDLPIFGNLHQINYRIGYDLEKQTVNFQQADCTKS